MNDDLTIYDPYYDSESMPFRALGYNHANFYFFSNRSKQILEINRGGLKDKGFLFSLAPLAWWEQNYRSKAGFSGDAVDMAVNMLIEGCIRCGVFKVEQLKRGRGAWVDNDRMVIHAGDKLIVDGENVDFTDFQTKYIYEADHGLGIDINNPLSNKEAHKFLELCKLLSWEKPINAMLLAGWCVIAPVGGALRWRPHMWVTAPAGTGKSFIVNHIMKKTTGNIAIHAQGDSTAPGIRSALDSGSQPVLFDEAESENSRTASIIDNVLGLMRMASSDEGGQVLKGTTDQKGNKFNVQSCFALCSINVNIKQHADATRICVLNLVPNNNDGYKNYFQEVIQPTANNLLTEEYAKRLQARAIINLKTLRKNALTFSTAATEFIGSQRFGDQIGAFLAGVYLLHTTKEISMNDARKFIAEQDWTDQEEMKEDSDHLKLFNRLLQYVTMVKTSTSTHNRNISELIYVALGKNLSDTIQPAEARKDLERIGIKVTDDAVYVANKHSGIERILWSTPWETGWDKALQKIPTVEKKSYPQRFSGITLRATKLPLELFK